LHGLDFALPRRASRCFQFETALALESRQQRKFAIDTLRRFQLFRNL
jgi:hypothetical protein